MGGMGINEDNRIAKAQRQWERDEAKRVNAKRMVLSDKIVMAVIDRIANDIIRPGPKPEERECYVMAQELRDSCKDLSILVSSILKVEQEEQDD